MVQRTGTRPAGESALPDPAAGWSARLELASGGRGVVAHAGVVLPRLLADRVILLGTRPGRVVEEFQVRVSRPRQINTADVAELAAHITGRLHEEGSGNRGR